MWLWPIVGTLIYFRRDNMDVKVQVVVVFSNWFWCFDLQATEESDNMERARMREERYKELGVVAEVCCHVCALCNARICILVCFYVCLSFYLYACQCVHLTVYVLFERFYSHAVFHHAVRLRV
jgi:hypothetical protein